MVTSFMVVLMVMCPVIVTVVVRLGIMIVIGGHEICLGDGLS